MTFAFSRTLNLAKCLLMCRCNLQPLKLLWPLGSNVLTQEGIDATDIPEGLGGFST